MNREDTSKIIYVGNIQSIDDASLREYFQRFGQIEEVFHQCPYAYDQWLIDYRFIRFSSDTNMNIFLTNQIDHTIGRIRLDIHSYESVFHDDTRLISDRKLCIAHTNPKLDRNMIKKSFARHGRILNCVCVSSGSGTEYVYIEFESINSIRTILATGQNYCVARTSLTVRATQRPVQSIDMKTECLSQQQLKQFEHDYDMIIRQDFDEIIYQIDKYLRKFKEYFE